MERKEHKRKDREGKGRKGKMALHSETGKIEGKKSKLRKEKQRIAQSSIAS